MKELVYKFLDRHYPINNKIIDISFNIKVHEVISQVFGITDILFKDWVIDRIGDEFALQYPNNYRVHITWFKNDLLHRDNDLPAVIYSDGTKCWYKKGNKHRDNDKPAVINRDSGSKYWYKNGQLHSYNDQPAVIDSDGSKFWFKNGLLHRDNDKPAEINSNGNMYWYQNNKKHRENGPAVIRYDGLLEWWLNGEYLKSYALEN